MTPGELYWVNFPSSNGHEQHGRRPAIVLQNDIYAAKLSIVFVVPVTSTLRNLRLPATVLVRPSESNGLYNESVILAHQARGMDRSRFGKRIGIIDPDTLAAIYEALDKLTGRIRSSEPS